MRTESGSTELTKRKPRGLAKLVHPPIKMVMTDERNYLTVPVLDL